MIRDRVLIIDDDPDFRELVKIVVESWGFVCSEAPDCAAALRLIAEVSDSLRIVLLDYSMPGLEPCECVERLKRMLSGVPIVLVSACVDITERARSIGLAEVLAKPFEMADLELAIKGPRSA